MAPGSASTGHSFKWWNRVTDRNFGSLKCNSMIISNSPQPDSQTSKGGARITSMWWASCEGYKKAEYRYRRNSVSIRFQKNHLTVVRKDYLTASWFLKAFVKTKYNVTTPVTDILTTITLNKHL
jgi:hypothetical protein